jgi:hypothetical protein
MKLACEICGTISQFRSNFDQGTQFPILLGGHLSFACFLGARSACPFFHLSIPSNLGIGTKNSPLTLAFFRIEKGQANRHSAGVPLQKGTPAWSKSNGAADRPASGARKVAAGPARRMQSALALKSEPDRQEF